MAFRRLRNVCALALVTSFCLIESGAWGREPAADRTGEDDFIQGKDPRALEKDDGPVVTFSGLKVHSDGSSTFVVDLSRSTPVEVTQKGNTVHFLLKGARVALRTNRYPLQAEYFGSNVLRTKLDNEKAGARLEIRLRTATVPAHEMISHAGGAILRIDIPAASSKSGS